MTSKISECSVRGWIPKKHLELETMRMFRTEFDISHEDCRKHCQKQSECISYVWQMSNRTGIYGSCRYSNVVLNVSNVERTNIETHLVGLKYGNDIIFTYIFITECEILLNILIENEYPIIIFS